MRIFIVIFILFIATFSIYSDVILTWDNSIINGKIIYILTDAVKRNPPQLIKIKTSVGVLTIGYEKILSYWITTTPEEDLKIYEKLGKKLTNEERKAIFDYYQYNVKVKEDFINQDKDDQQSETVINKNLFGQFSNLKKTGVAFFITGPGLMIAGLSLVIVDAVYFKDLLKMELLENPRDYAGYQSYLNAYYTYISLLATGVSVLSIGTVLLVTGFPLFFYNPQKKLSFQVFLNHNALCLNLRFSF